MQFERIAYGGWANCYRLANQQVEVIITADVGPRIIRFGFVNAPNEFAEFADEIGKTGGDEWRSYGGHRLWHAPEDTVRTYFPDNQPVQVERKNDIVHVTQQVEPTTQIEKTLELHLSPDDAHVRVVHRLRNCGMWPVELSVWALSVMAAGGTGIFPHAPRGTHGESLLPTHPLVLWAYTDMSDPRWTWGQKYVLLRQDVNSSTPQKFGMAVPAGWTAYARDGRLFVKTFKHHAGGTYPDFGCSVESFTNNQMLEVETLAPLVTLAPNETAEHVENWFLFRDIPAPQNDADVERDVLPRVNEALRYAPGRKVV